MVGVVFLVTFVATLTWVHCSTQTYVPRSWGYSVKLVLRVALLMGVLKLISSVVGLPMLGVVIFLVFIALSLSSFGDPAGIAVIGGFWALQQYILGFPDLEKVKLQVPEPQPESSDFDLLIGKSGEAKTPLAPSGSVVIEGSSYNAVTEDRSYVERGTSVVVRQIKNQQLVVCVDAQ